MFGSSSDVWGIELKIFKNCKNLKFSILSDLDNKGINWAPLLSINIYRVDDEQTTFFFLELTIDAWAVWAVLRFGFVHSTDILE